MDCEDCIKIPENSDQTQMETDPPMMTNGKVDISAPPYKTQDRLNRIKVHSIHPTGNFENK